MVFQDSTTKEDFLTLLHLKDRTRGQKKYVDENCIPIQKLVAIPTDGAPAMRSGFIALCRSDPAFPDFVNYHCVIHQQALVGKVVDFSHVMTLLVKLINSIRAEALQQRLFKALLDELDAAYGDLILYADVWWQTGKLPPSFTVRVGDEVTLPCENVKDGQQECENTTWLFVGSGNTAAVKLVKLGQIGENTKAKSDRLSVTENCSLVIKKVTDQEVGRYHCRQFISKQQQVPDSRVLLSLIIMTERKDADKVTLNCSVSKYEQSCIHTVKWLYEGKDVDKDKKT
ncbi:uncharacterized protein LOC119918663 [Micropterus salmoides]|uniref:uncharacterized protein LOC119918663 n=1 Tax=Micropterus salmoides TaxID=27706 RepID=UPI0018ED8349|nr:uncharacterized protein LOC119918663 [Micropterus salmoides]